MRKNLGTLPEFLVRTLKSKSSWKVASEAEPLLNLMSFKGEHVCGKFLLHGSTFPRDYSTGCSRPHITSEGKEVPRA